MPGTKPARIAFLVKPGNLPLVEILRGFRSYRSSGRAWRVLHRDPGSAAELDWLAQQGVDGMVIHVASRADLERCMTFAVPAANISGRFSPAELLGLPLCTLRMDERAAGAVAAGHLMSLGLEHFGLLGTASLHYSTERYAGFKKKLADQGYGCRAFWADREDACDECSRAAQEPPENAIADFIALLPKPCGILATDLGYADRLCDLATNLGYSVPAEVAIVAGHDGDIAAHCADPPLTAVKLPLVQLGYRAAEALDCLLSGRPVPEYGPLSPLGIQARGSTDMLATGDPFVRRAIAFIRREALRKCTVAKVVAEVSCSRSYLDRAFRETLGHTVFEEIRRRRLAAAREMLIHTDETIGTIATACGFSGAMRFSQIFRESHRRTPSQYRLQFRQRASV